MFANLAIIALTIMAVQADKKPAQYPANVSPAECPNYPFCGATPVEAESSGERTGREVAGIQTVYTASAPVQANAVYAGNNYLPYVYLAVPSQQAQFYSAAALPAQQYYYSTYSAPAVAAPQPVAAAPVAKPVAAPAAPATIEAPKFRKVELPIEYPAGLSPAACPNYPYCTTELQYARFKYEPVGAGYADNSIEARSAAIPAGDKYPANFDSTKCIDYPFCTQGTA